MINVANQRQECDVIILARGGGSLEDLWPFNEEVVAHAIFASQIPIVCGVGHETDFTIADYVADLRSATPSVAAEMVAPNQAEWSKQLSQQFSQLQHLIGQHIRQFKIKIDTMQQRLRHPQQIIQQKIQRVDQLEKRIQLAIQNTLTHKQNKFQHLTKNLNTLSPLNTLSRGYAIVSDQQTKQVIDTIDKVKVDDAIKIKLVDGQLSCQVYSPAK